MLADQEPVGTASRCCQFVENLGRHLNHFCTAHDHHGSALTLTRTRLDPGAELLEVMLEAAGQWSGHGSGRRAQDVAGPARHGPIGGAARLVGQFESVGEAEAGWRSHRATVCAPVSSRPEMRTSSGRFADGGKMVAQIVNS